MAGLLSIAVQGIAGGIGLASESIHARKEKKQVNTLAADTKEIRDGSDTLPIDHQSFQNEKDLALEEDDVQWELDDAQDELTSTESPEENQPAADAARTTKAFLQRYPPPVDPSADNAIALSRLALPVILPQRRPKNRSRGFIRAYAPALESCGIDQAMFLDFLDTFQKSSEASPWIQSINIAGGVMGLVPEPATMIAGIVLQVIGRVATEVDGRHRTNTFLDKANTDFFRPRGLFCLVMTWRPGSTESHALVDLSATVFSSVGRSSKAGVSKFVDNLKISSGKTYGDLEFPEAAPLVFPALDKLAGDEGEEAKSKREKMKKKKEFVDNYWDRRAQAKYGGQNPDNPLAKSTPKASFTSRYADPNHPASNGNLISLVTGGYINPPSLGSGLGGGRGFGGRLGGSKGLGGLGGLLGERAGGLGGRLGGGGFGTGRGGMGHEQDMYQQGLYAAGRANFGARPQGGAGGVMRLLQQDVLYLMIVPMPSEEELAAAEAALRSPSQVLPAQQQQQQEEGIH